MLISVFVGAVIGVMFFHSEARRDSEEGSERAAMRKHTFAFGGTEAGAFWSGSMRCPKCRAEMEQVDCDGIEIDRCKYCKGIWFDAGESEALRDKEAAIAIDIGDAERGKQSNKFDDYPCPRCSGAMVRVVDAQQTHIWYEVCSSCRGSFFDAGEFIDLAEHTISDFFKRFTTPERK